MMQPSPTIEWVAWPRRPTSSKTNFAGKCCLGRAQRPAQVVQIERRVGVAEVHVRVVVSLERADVAPVEGLVRRLAGKAVFGEVVGEDAEALQVLRDHVAPEIVPLVGMRLGLAAQDLDERAGVEQIVAHRGEAEAG